MELKKLASETVYQENLKRTDISVPLTKFKKSHAEFDEHGNQTKEMSWDSNGNIEQILLSYYEDGKLIRQEVFLDEDEKTEEREFIYSEEGKLLTEICTYAESGQETIKHEYDHAGHLIRKVYHDEDDTIESLEEWKYEKENLVWERRVEDGEVVYEHKWEYNGDDLISEYINEEFVEMRVVHEPGNPEMRKQIRNGVLISTQSTQFDEGGKPIRVEDTSAQGTRVITVDYDEKGNEILRQELGPQGNLVVKIQRKLNDSGDLLEMEVEANTRGIGIDRHYKYSYEYSYIE